MTEKYCLLPISTCEFGTDRKADCENCELNKRFRKITIDNWESYIEDRKTGKEYGADINPLINLLNEQEERIQELKKENEELNIRIERLKEVIRAEPFARAEGEITRVKTDDFIRICKENNELIKDNEQLKQKLKSINGLMAFDRPTDQTDKITCVWNKDLIKLDFGGIDD